MPNLPPWVADWWKPIETAPKDGDSILVCTDEKMGGFHQVVFWDDESTDPKRHWATSDGPTYHDGLFSHWMPLPPQPRTGPQS